MKRIAVVLILNFFIYQVFALNVFAYSEDAGKSFSEITVIAQKSKENLQEVPISVTVLGSESIEDMNIGSIQDIAQYTPNFYLFNPGDCGIISPSIRGIYSDIETLSTSVGMYVDGVPVLNTIGYDFILEDIERIEILKGPQGTLYGKNAEAGVINVITKKPGNTLSAKVSTELGSDDKKLFSANLSTPIVTDKLSIGLSGRFYEKDGFLKNTYLDKVENDRENKFGKVYLNFTPTDRLDISLISLKLKRDDGSNSLNIMTAENKRETQCDIEGYGRLETLSHAFKVSYKFNNFDLNSITSYKEQKDIRLTDMDASSIEYWHGQFDSTYENFTQELRLNYKKEKVDFLVGLSADKGDYNIVNMRYSIVPSYAGETEQDAEDLSFGIFSHMTYSINDKFSLSGGLRFDKDDKELSIAAQGLDFDNSYSEISPKISAEYKINPDVMTYATIAKGYKAGGFYIHAADGYSREYDKETLWNYEIGVKSSLLNNTLLLNISAYYMDISDMQVLTGVDAYDGYMSNAASASSKGFELETQYKLTPELRLFFSAGYNITKFDDFSDANGDYKDNYNPYAPKYNYSVGGQYRSHMGFFARIDFTGYGKMYLDKANEYEKDAYFLLNGKIGYETEHFDIYLYGKNILDEEYDSEGYYNGQYIYLSDPKEVGVQLTYRF